MILAKSFVAGEWVGHGTPRILPSAVTGAPVAEALGGAEPQAMLDYARGVGGPSLRKLTFHDRARRLKALALYLNDRRDQLYPLSYQTGATHADSKIDIDGGIGTMLVYASKGRREMPDDHLLPDGDLEMLSRKGTFLGQHYCTPLLGAAIHINAFNFPVWGMLEKLAPTLLAGVPAIVKPATATCYLTEACFRLMIEADIFPPGSLQLIIGSTADLLDRLDCQDVVSFTGSAETALALRSNPRLLAQSTRFIAEQDSLNATLLAPDIAPDSTEFDLFVAEATKEITTKAGQKCTTIRRIMVPEDRIDAIAKALSRKLEGVCIGDPADKATQMGALASIDQKTDVLAKATKIATEADTVYTGALDLPDALSKGAFVAPQLFLCVDPDSGIQVHDIEAFGPVSTLMPYRDLDHGCALLNRGGGSLVASVVTRDAETARRIVQGSGPFHGRLYFNNADSAAEATGHGSPLPHMIHGGPGRAGGGEELGGIRGVKHYMARVAVQGSPDLLTGIGCTWVKGSAELEPPEHPFRRTFDDLRVGDTLWTETRQVKMDDIEHFAHFTGDTFYAHMDEKAAAANPFFPGRVAHGYLLLSFAAGLFVQPDPGPVLANTGLNDLSFQAPVSAGDTLRVRLVAKRKTRRTEDYGEVRWDVTLYNQDDAQVATYELLTMVAYG